MNLFQINQIYQSLAKIANNNFPIEQAYDIFLLIKKLEKEIEFFRYKEKQLIDQYASEVKSNGEITFSEEDMKKAFSVEYNKLKQAQGKESYEKIYLPLSTLKDCNLTPADFFILEEVIEFIKDEQIE